MTSLRIGIVGAGFSGTSLAATLQRLAKNPVEIYLFEKSGQFGPGVAYSTASPFHLLNVRAEDMSAIEMDKGHFSDWLKRNKDTERYAGKWMCADEQYVSRYLYGDYLRALIAEMSASSMVRLHLIPEAVTGIFPFSKNSQISSQHQTVTVDRVVLSTGNTLPPRPLFSVKDTSRLIDNPWDQAVFSRIAPEDSVVLLGSGLSTIDSVLSLYHRQHQGKIYSVSRHGLLPLSHNEVFAAYVFSGNFPESLLELIKHIRAESAVWMRKGGDWRAIVHAIREHIPAIWGHLSATDRSHFLRHWQTIWNIHRHRVPQDVRALLQQLQDAGQFRVISGRVLSFQDKTLQIKQRGINKLSSLPANWVINCTGLSPDLRKDSLIRFLLEQGMAQSDPHGLGLCVSPKGALYDAKGVESSVLFALGSLCRGAFWEITAVPDIRRYNYQLATHLLF